MALSRNLGEDISLRRVLRVLGRALLTYSVECEEIIFRAILKPGWLDENKHITASAFIRDPKKDKDGLSVNIKSKTDLNTWLSSFNKSLGADSLHNGRVRTLKLDVRSKRLQWEKISRGHAVIVDLPYADDDPDRAESLASELAKMSRSFDREVRKKKR